MERYNGQLIRQFASNVSGNAASGVAVTVRKKSDGAIATLYADNNTAGATLSNPLTTSAVGHFAFYAADGVYTLTFSDNTPQQVIQLQDVGALQVQFNAAVLAGGYIPSGTFAVGATLTQANQILSDGSAYWRWDGALPKAVSAGSVPTPTGVGGWIVLSDQALRGDLAADNSAVLVGGVEAGDVGKVARLFVTPEMFGAVGDGIANDSAAIKSWLESPHKKAAKKGAAYNLGLLAGDASLASTAGIDHDIDFNFCKIVCAGDISAVYTATAMLRVTNGRLCVKNLAGFNDTNFASRGAGRGVAPWLIVNEGVSTDGYSFDNIVLDNCQSFGTFFSSDAQFQARGISFGAGCVITGNCERGITLSSSGSSIGGSFKLSGTVNRNLFAQNVSGIDLLIYGGTCTASSGNVLIICDDAQTVRGVKLKLVNEKIYSVSLVAKGAASIFKDVNIDVWTNEVGDVNTEVVRLGVQDDAGNWLPAVNFTAKEVSFRIRSNTKSFVEFGMQTYSTNVQYVSLDVFGNYTFYNKGEKTYFEMKNKFYKSETLASVATPLAIDTSRFIKNLANIGLEVYVKGVGSGGVEIAAKYYVKAFKASDGTLSAFSSASIYSFPTLGGGATLSSSGQNINVTFSGFTGAVSGTAAVTLLEF